MKKKNALVVGAAIAVAVILCGAVASTVRVYQNASQASRLISALRGVNIGSSTEAESRSLLSPFNDIASEEHGNRNEISYIFFNTGMNRWRLAPYAHLQIVLTFQNGIAAQKSITLFAAGGYAGTVEQEVWRGEQGYDELVGNHDPDRPSRLVQGYKNDRGNYARLDIRDDSRLPAEQLNADWDINVKCLYKFGGCQDARQILPSLGSTPIPDQEQ